MSHYSVLVCMDESVSLECLLEKYNENRVVDKYIQYTKSELIAQERRSLQDFYDCSYSEFLKDEKAYREKFKDNLGHLKYISETFPKIYNMSDDELFKYLVDMYEYELDEKGNVLSIYNPDSKWDWYVVGGRFSGLLRRKDTEESVDFGYARELDFSPNHDEYKRALRFWEICVDGEKPETEEEKTFAMIYKKEYFLRKYGSKEEYAKIQSEFTTWAVLTPNGEWYEPGQMGWFGCSSASEEEEFQFLKDYSKFIEKAIENNWYLTVVDCHI